MAHVTFTANLQRHVKVASLTVPGKNLAEVLQSVFAAHPPLKNYLLDDQQALRRHVAIFVDGAQVTDRRQMRDAVAPDSEIYISQALSGG